MNITAQIKAFQLLERLLNNGHTIATLPIDTQRAKGIVECREQATEADLQALSIAANSNGAVYGGRGEA
jgi:hypothetical protein